jgi:hypothetical protein
MKIRIVDKYLVATKGLPKEPMETFAYLKEGDELCGLQIGLKGIVPRKRFLKKYTNTLIGRLSAICVGAEKVVFKIRFKL